MQHVSLLPAANKPKKLNSALLFGVEWGKGQVRYLLYFLTITFDVCFVGALLKALYLWLTSSAPVKSK